MRFSGLFAAGAGLLGAVNAQSSAAAVSSKPGGGSSVAKSSSMMQTYPPQCLNIAVNSIPLCGLELLTKTASASYGCALADLQCQCSNSAALQNAIYSPVLSACGGATALQVLTGAAQVCQCVTYGSTVPGSIDVTRTTAQVNPLGNQLCVSYGLAIPTCGTAVLQSLGGKIAGCGPFDFECQCQHISSIQDMASTPVINVCGTTTALLVQSAADLLCSCITANNKGLPPASGTIPAVPTATPAKASAAALRGEHVPVGGLAGVLSIFSGLLAMLL